MQWHKSLYWRIAIGFVAFLAAVLVAQAMVFVWLIARSGRTVPGQSPGRFSETVALDLANAMERDAVLDVAKYVREQYAQTTHPFFVMLADGTVITNGSSDFPEALLRSARARLQRRFDRPDGAPFGRGRFGRFDDGDQAAPRWEPGGRRDGGFREGPPRDGSLREGSPRDGSIRDGSSREGSRGDGFPPPFGRGPREGPEGGPRFVRPTPIVVNGRLAGVVVVPPEAPFSVVLGRFAPMLGAIAAGVLIVGTIAASLLIFGPPRRRLRQLEDAARRFGTGDLSARAPGRGGDEIAAVASAFNTMADDLTARAEALAASDKARRQLLADVSHELTTPVTTMRGYLETLAMPELQLDGETRARYLQIITDETLRLERIIGDLLDLARLEGGGGAFSVEDVPVEQLFDRVQARHERSAGNHGVTIRSTIEPGAATVRGDRDRLEQALQNLAGNAMRYAPAGSTISLRAKPTAEGVTFSVEDQGPGIPAEHLPHVFDRFYKAEASRTLDRADGTRESTSNGSGLGLSIVKAIVERHGGRISVESTPGRTVFQFTLDN